MIEPLEHICRYKYCKPTIIHNFFCDLHKMNWLIAINFREQALSTPVFVLQLYNKYRSTVRNILNSWILTKISHIRIKVGLQ